MKFLFTFFEPAHHVFIWYSSTILGTLLLITVAQPIDQDHLNLVRRHTPYGDVLGFVHHGKIASAECYLGIPYARPPINDRRFAYPEPVDHWINLYNATYFRPWCVQFWYSDVYLEKREQSEDCLYLNIFVPRQTVHAKPYPVLVWIHGGSYQVGGSQLFPINGTVDNIVSHGVIFVSINYRLGPLGFLTNMRSGLFGNYGLEDQIVALQWIKDTIGLFDGDASRITVGGESSGAASVSILATSPRTIGLFQRAVIRSGSAMSPWAIQSTNTDLNSARLIEVTNCSFNDDKKTMECLRTLSISQMKNIWKLLADDGMKLIYSKSDSKSINYNHPFLAHTYFTPVVDKYRENQSIIPLPAERLIRENARLPLMIGSTTGECIAYVSWLAYLAENDRIDLCNIEFVAPSFRFKNAEQVKQAIYQHYFDNRPIQQDTNLSHILVKIVTDQNIKVPMMKEISYYTNKNVPIFVYSFDYSDDKLQNMHLSFAMRDQGAAHGFDLVYLFQSMSVLDPRNITVEWASEDLNITYFIASTMTNFVKFGNPNLQTESNKLQFHWPAFDFPSSQQMYIGSQIKPIEVPFELLYFWNRTIEIIQTLSLQHDFIFEPPTVANFHCGVFEDYDLLNYRVAFFTVLTLSLAMLFLLGFCCFLHVNYRNQEKSIPTVVE
ncbi:Neuroligin-4, X-linked [Trichinella zimbabwensis]|uniref:Neuroligin-4, X-linked n=1 Tax=Trichinella zimbabwensis TaxID=268475 RepID=A0A0V1HFV9_9BILA|nr:Neuroligin-4, X-linked [Trichinella zimbabwensis]